MYAFLGQSWESVFQLLADVGYGLQPIEGIAYDQVTVRLKKSGLGFVTRNLLSAEWVDRGNGFYSIIWTDSDMDTEGSLAFTVDYPYQVSSYIEFMQVVPSPMYIDNASPYCVVSGNIVDIGGAPDVYQHIVFRPPHVPVKSGVSLVSSNLIRTTTDAFGNFTVKLLRGAKVMVEIERAGIRYLITVPNQPSALILDLLPPIPA